MTEPVDESLESPTGERPNHTYYRACEGRWTSPLEFVITDHAALRRSGMRLFDRLNMIGMVWAARLFGAFVMETSVDYATGGASGRVVHTTAAKKWGFTLFSSVEVFELDPNGHDARMSARMKLPSAPWRVMAFEGAPVTVDASATRATYRFPWFGVEMRQSTERSADGMSVTVTQETDFSRGVQVLRRAA